MSKRAFAVFLQELRDGRTHTELTTQFAALLAAVKETGKGGSLTVVFTVKPAGRGADVDKVVIMDKVACKLPTAERGDDFYWLTEENDLSRNHPKQSTLDLRDATPAPLTFKEVAK